MGDLCTARRNEVPGIELPGQFIGLADEAQFRIRVAFTSKLIEELDVRLCVHCALFSSWQTSLCHSSFVYQEGTSSMVRLLEQSLIECVIGIDTLLPPEHFLRTLPCGLSHLYGDLRMF